jgi:hypothetical protein
VNRHRFEPARLLLGVLLIAAAAGYALDALGEWRVPVWAQLAAMPAVLTLAAFTAWTTFAVRRCKRRSGTGESAALGTSASDGTRRGGP